MTPQPEQSKNALPGTVPRRKQPVMWYVGWPVMIFGIVTTTMFTVRHFTELTAGNTYYEFIIPGIVIAVIGFVMLIISRPSAPRI